MNKIGIGFIGTGFARTTQAPVFRTFSDDVALIAVCSGSIENARTMAEQFGMPHACASHEELVAIDDVSLVVVSSPPYLHHRATIAALEAGKHVICEKPMSLNSNEASEMTRVALARPDQLSIIDHELRFNPTWQRMKKLLDDRVIGKVYHVNVTIATGFRHSAERPWNWWAQKSAGGGLLGALGSHAIDALRWLIGEIEEVTGDVATVVPGRVDPETGNLRPVETDDYCSFLVHFAGDSGYRASGVVVLSAVFASGGKNQIAIAGELGTIILDGDERLSVAAGFNREFEDMSVADPARTISEIPGNIWSRSFYHLACKVIASLKSGKSTVEGAATFEDGLRCQQVIDAIHRSHKTREWQHL